MVCEFQSNIVKYCNIPEEYTVERLQLKTFNNKRNFVLNCTCWSLSRTASWPLTSEHVIRVLYFCYVSFLNSLSLFKKLILNCCCAIYEIVGIYNNILTSPWSEDLRRNSTTITYTHWLISSKIGQDLTVEADL